MAEVLLANKGLVALVDDDDLAIVEGIRWYATRNERANSTWYAIAQGSVYMHRLLMGFPKGLTVDHINGNGLDNRRANLRIATRSQNLANRGIQRQRRPKSSRFKGVCWDRSRGLWTAYIVVAARQKSLGRFTSEADAAHAYDAAALDTWGEFARPNFPASTTQAGQ
jgi:hypothetical protein